MAILKVGTTHGMRKVAFEQELFRDTVVNSFFLPRFAKDAVSAFLNGTGWKGTVYESAPDGIIQVKADLGLKGRGKGVTEGDKITFGIGVRLDPKVHPGVTGDQTAKGKEVDATVYTDSIELQRYRFPVSGGDYMTWQRAGFNVDALSQGLMKNLGMEKMDLICL